MNMNKRIKTAKQLGFTLIELLIVIAIMAILTGILMASLVKGAQEKKRATEEVAMLTNISTAEYEAVDSYKYTAFQDQSKICGVSEAGGHVLSAFCINSSGSLGETLNPPVGTVTITPNGNTSYKVELDNLTDSVSDAVLAAFPSNCTGSGDTVTCDFGVTSGSS